MPDMKPSDGVVFAACDDEGVLLDVAKGRFYGIGHESAVIWKALMRCRSTGEITKSVATELEIDTERARTLVVRQMESWQAVDLVGRALPIGEWDVHPMPRRATLDYKPLQPIGARAMIRGLHEMSQAHRLRERLDNVGGLLATIVAMLGNPATYTRDLEDATPLLLASRIRRVFFQQGTRDCLPRSIALALALRKRAVEVRFIIGVRKFPFQAHAWVESGDFVLEDRVTDIASFQPILSVGDPPHPERLLRTA